MSDATTTNYGYPIIDNDDQYDTDWVTKLATLAGMLDTDMFGKQPLAARLTSIVATGITTAMLATGVLDTDGSGASVGAAKVWSSLAAKTYSDSLFASNDALLYKGAIDASTNPNYPAADAGHLYRISVAGKIGGASGVNVEVGDTATCILDSSASGNQATVGANWNIIQANLDGAVIGPASSTSGNIATFSGTGGKLIQDSGYTLDQSVGTASTVQHAAINLGHATDTTISRVSAGLIAVEGNTVAMLTGVQAFGSRPTFNGNTPYDSANLPGTAVAWSVAQVLPAASAIASATVGIKFNNSASDYLNTIDKDGTGVSSTLNSASRGWRWVNSNGTMASVSSGGALTVAGGITGASNLTMNGGSGHTYFIQQSPTGFDAATIWNLAGAGRFYGGVTLGDGNWHLISYGFGTIIDDNYTSGLTTLHGALKLNLGAGTLVTDASGNVTASSDARLKNIKGAYTRGLDDLRKMGAPVLFGWKSEEADVKEAKQNLSSHRSEMARHVKELASAKIRLSQATGDKIKGAKEEVSGATARLAAIRNKLARHERVAALTNHDTTYAGWLAQDAAKGIPEAVKTGPDGMLTLEERPIVAALYNAVLAMADRLDALEARLAA